MLIAALVARACLPLYSVYAPLQEMKLPLYCRQDSPERGRHLVASVPLERNQLIFVERPLVSLQSLSNIHTNPACGFCRAVCGDSNTKWGMASGRLQRHELTAHLDASVVVACRRGCGQAYCSHECQDDDWKAGGHRWLCTGTIEHEDHPLVQFKLYAIQHNEIFLMVADAVVKMILSDDFRNNMLDFCRTPWWKVATEPMLKSPTGLSEAAQLDATLQRLCHESSALLKEALLLQQQQQQHSTNVFNVSLIHELCTADSFGKIIGSFEQNAIGIRQRNPLCREIFKRDVRERYRDDLIACLERAGMIGTSGEDEESSLEEEAIGNFHKDNGEYEYSDDEIAQFLAGLDMTEQSDSHDLDQVFLPLDGTAMYATACKMNHSCDPNVAILYKQCGTVTPLLAYCVALRDICEGEELCISYIDSNELLSVRQEALANYGFQCECEKCRREGTGEDVCKVAAEPETFDEDDLFGPGDDDSDDEKSEENDDSNKVDGESALRLRREELYQALNKTAANMIPVNVLAVACNHVVRACAAAMEALPKDLQVMTQQCAEAVRTRDFVLCCKIGSVLEEKLYRILQEKGSWPDTAHRQAHGCGALTCSIGNLLVGSLPTAQTMLDKTFILGLPRDEIAEFFDFVEYFANQASHAPCRPAGQCILDNAIGRSRLEPLTFFIPEASPNITSEEFESQCVSKLKAVVFRDFASDWIATTKWW